MLSICLPVHNAQGFLPRLVTEVLEAVEELTNRFEILAIDNGSRDATVEVAAELEAEYPQVRMIALPQQLGRPLVVRRALQEACGEVIAIRDFGCDLPPSTLPRLWDKLPEADAVFARQTSARATGWAALIDRLGSRGLTPPAQGAGNAADGDVIDWQLFRRRATDGIPWAMLSYGELRSALVSRGRTALELNGPATEHRLGQIPVLPEAAAEAVPQAPTRGGWWPGKKPTPAAPRRPAYLAGFKRAPSDR